MAPERANQFKMLLSDEELAMLRELAEHRGLTASDYLRTLIRDQHRELALEGVNKILDGAERLVKPKRKKKRT